MATRHENQQQTRATLLRIGEEEVRRVGIYKASLRGIASKAGFTLGAFYSNFPSRDAFLLEIFAGIMDRVFKSLSDVIDVAVKHGQDDAIKDIEEWLTRSRNNITSTLLLEFSIYSAHNKEFRILFQPYLKNLHKQIADSLARLLKGLGRSSSFPNDVIASGFFALWQGLTLDAANDFTNADKSLVLWLRMLLSNSK